ncbi:MAG: hypothetical protein AAGI71_03790 [Bacteroidota bacterium]
MLSCALLVALPVHAQEAQTVGLGGAGAASPWAPASLNPAAPGHREEPSLTLSVHQPYGLPALRAANAALVLPLRVVVLGADLRALGQTPYQEHHWAFSAAATWTLPGGRRLRLGVRSALHQVSIAGYGQARAVGLSVGWLAPLTPFLDAGCSATNLNRPRWTRHSALPTGLQCGLAYRLPADVHVVADVRKEAAHPAEVAGGVAVTLASALIVRVGLTTWPVRTALGLSIDLGIGHVHLGADQHPDLGWSPTLTLELAW